MPGKTATIKPTPRVDSPEVTTKPYFTTGWTVPQLNISSEQIVMIGIAGLMILLVLGVIAYISVGRKMRDPGEDEDEYEDDD
jgi:hypothetical protein